MIIALHELCCIKLSPVFKVITGFLNEWPFITGLTRSNIFLLYSS